MQYGFYRVALVSDVGYAALLDLYAMGAWKERFG